MLMQSLHNSVFKLTIPNFNDTIHRLKTFFSFPILWMYANVLYAHFYFSFIFYTAFNYKHVRKDTQLLFLLWISEHLYH